MRILIAIAFLFAKVAVAQISITQSAMPGNNDTIRYSTANGVGLDLKLGTKGSNQTWDYSDLTPTGQDLYSYKSANSTPYAFYFFNQIGLKTADSLGALTFTFRNIYSFYTKSSSVFKAEGIGYSYSGIPLSSKYSDDDEVYQFPLNYNDSDVSTFHFKFSIPGVNTFAYAQSGKRINDVDGWGSIKTPYKTYNNVLRVKTTLLQVDTIITQFAKIPVPRPQVIYKWLSADEKIPVLEIAGTEVGGVFTPNQIRYRDKFLGLSNPLAPRAGFTINKTSGFVQVDTFKLSDRSMPFATSYQWQIYPTNGVKYVSGTTSASRNPELIFAQKGLYSVTLVATNFAGSGDTTAVDLISVDYGLTKNEISINQLTIQPNPASDKVFFDAEGRGIVAITDILGKNVYSATINFTEGIDISNMNPGLYFVSLTSNGVQKFGRFEKINR